MRRTFPVYDNQRPKVKIKVYRIIQAVDRVDRRTDLIFKKYPLIA